MFMSKSVLPRTAILHAFSRAVGVRGDQGRMPSSALEIILFIMVVKSISWAPSFYRGFSKAALLDYIFAASFLHRTQT